MCGGGGGGGITIGKKRLYEFRTIQYTVVLPIGIISVGWGKGETHPLTVAITSQLSFEKILVKMPYDICKDTEAQILPLLHV